MNILINLIKKIATIVKPTPYNPKTDPHSHYNSPMERALRRFNATNPAFTGKPKLCPMSSPQFPHFYDEALIEGDNVMCPVCRQTMGVMMDSALVSNPLPNPLPKSDEPILVSGVWDGYLYYPKPTKGGPTGHGSN